MSCIDKKDLASLKLFLDMCLKQPSILHKPELLFVKAFVESFGGKIPEQKDDNESTKKSESKNNSNESETKTKTESESEEKDDSDVEFDMTGVIEPDTDAPQEMGDPNLEPTEEAIAESDNKRIEGAAAFIEKEYEKAVEHYTKAIVLNPQASLLFTKRGQIYYLLNKPNACIRDCNRALELNPDSAAAHKYRGRAYQLLGKWEEAVNDLRLACKYDFDEEADQWLREATPNALKQRQKMKEREPKKQPKMEKEKESAKTTEGSAPRGPQSGAGKRPGFGDFSQYLSDPEVLKALEDPDLSEALKDISQNPMNILKYQSNPKVMAFINTIISKYSGGSGMPGFSGAGGMPGFPGAEGMPGFPGAGGIPGFPGAGGMPGFPGAGGMPGFPGAGAMPNFPGSMPSNIPKAKPKDDGDLD